MKKKKENEINEKQTAEVKTQSKKIGNTIGNMNYEKELQKIKKEQ